MRLYSIFWCKCAKMVNNHLSTILKKEVKNKRGLNDP